MARITVGNKARYYRRFSITGWLRALPGIIRSPGARARRSGYIYEKRNLIVIVSLLSECFVVHFRHNKLPFAINDEVSVTGTQGRFA
jgi:hypothetical protein